MLFNKIDKIYHKVITTTIKIYKAIHKIHPLNNKLLNKEYNRITNLTIHKEIKLTSKLISKEIN